MAPPCAPVSEVLNEYRSLTPVQSSSLQFPPQVRGTFQATLTRKGQMTMPKTVREALGLRVGDRVECAIVDGEARLRPFRRSTARELRQLLRPLGVPSPGPEAERAALRTALAEQYVQGSSRHAAPLRYEHSAAAGRGEIPDLFERALRRVERAKAGELALVVHPLPAAEACYVAGGYHRLSRPEVRNRLEAVLSLRTCRYGMRAPSGRLWRW